MFYADEKKYEICKYSKRSVFESNCKKKSKIDDVWVELSIFENCFYVYVIKYNLSMKSISVYYIDFDTK